MNTEEPVIGDRDRKRAPFLVLGLEVEPETSKMFDACGRQLNVFMSVGILLQYFRRKLRVQFE